MWKSAARRVRGAHRGERAELGGELSGGYTAADDLRGNNKMRIFQEEIFGPVLAVTRLSDYDDAMKIATTRCTGLGAGVWSRDTNTATVRAVTPGRPGAVVNNYHAYPAPCGLRRLKQSGLVGRPQDDAGPLPADKKCWSATANALGFFLIAVASSRVDLTRSGGPDPPLRACTTAMSTTGRSC